MKNRKLPQVILHISTEEMLKQIIERAIKNGYREIYDNKLAYDLIINVPTKYNIDTTNELTIRGLLLKEDFAKAYWGAEPTCIFCGSNKTISRTSFDGEITEYYELCSVCNGEVSEETTIPAYLYQLQKAVIDKNLIEYIYLNPA